jgi:menaquinone-dependent protoporphyrinogen IX oxidase
MPVPVVYASKHGATGEIAERVAQTMAAAGQQAQARPVALGERALRKLSAARAIMPEGDFRDWAQIEAWARGIARDPALGTEGAGGSARTAGRQHDARL